MTCPSDRPKRGDGARTCVIPGPHQGGAQAELDELGPGDHG